MNDNKKEIFVKDTSKLQLHVFVLGYNPMGECILIVLWDKMDEMVRKSIFIDCFERNGINQMEVILKRYHLDNIKLDFIVWTHPDYDHSHGLENIIKKYTSNKTILLLPDGFYRALVYSPKAYLPFFTLLRYVHKGNIEIVNSSNIRKYPSVYGSTSYDDGYHESLDFDIEILTPFAGPSFLKSFLNKSFKNNDISISLMIRFGGQNFFFGGDIENQSIKMIQAERLFNVVFIKIPHHSSDTSQYLPELLTNIQSQNNMTEAISVTTAFKKGITNLPDYDVLDKYKNFSNIIITTIPIANKDDYGICELHYNIRPWEISFFNLGDSTVYYEDNSRNTHKRKKR